MKTNYELKLICLIKQQVVISPDGSVFRERSRGPHYPRQQQQALAEKFLKAIEEERQLEEEEEYKKQLRNLWNRYQLEEGDMEKYKKKLFQHSISVFFLTLESFLTMNLTPSMV